MTPKRKTREPSSERNVPLRVSAQSPIKRHAIAFVIAMTISIPLWIVSGDSLPWLLSASIPLVIYHVLMRLAHDERRNQRLDVDTWLFAATIVSAGYASFWLTRSADLVALIIIVSICAIAFGLRWWFRSQLSSMTSLLVDSVITTALLTCTTVWIVYSYLVD